MMENNVSKIEFVDEDNLGENFFCAICSDIYDDPVVLNCGHSFCLGCINNCKKNNNTVCPICRGKIKSRLIKNLVLNNIISEFKVYCLEKEGGCNWIGKKERLVDHLSNQCEIIKGKSKWECRYCKNKNNYILNECSKCQMKKMSDNEYICSECTFVNPMENEKCEMCEKERDEKEENHFINNEEEEEEEINQFYNNEESESEEIELLRRFTNHMDLRDDDQDSSSSHDHQNQIHHDHNLNFNFVFSQSSSSNLHSHANSNLNASTGGNFNLRLVNPKSVKQDLKRCLKSNPKMKEDMCFTILNEKYQNCDPTFLMFHVSKFHKKIKKKIEKKNKKKNRRYN